MPRLLLALCLLVASNAASAQVVLRSRIDEYARMEMARRHLPGLALLVLKDNREVLRANYGVMDLSSGVPVTGNTSFEIASLTKQFTDAAILLLAQRGKLAVTDRLSRHMPGLPPAWQAITIEQLMNHTAGLRDDWDEDDHFFTSRTTSAEFFDALKASPLKFEPGTDWSYSAGPFVLGLLIERLSGKPYAQFMREAIFDPLGMKSTVVNDGGARVRQLATGYVLRGGTLVRGVKISQAAHARADVGIRTTAHDLALWVNALDGRSFLTASSRARMFAPGHLTSGEAIAHGLGWFVTPFRGHTEIAHGGSFRTGFDSAIARYPDDGLTIIVLTNRFKARSTEIARAVASFYNSDYRPIDMMEPRPDGDAARTSTAARILEALKAGSRAEELLPDVGRLGGWSREELREELQAASTPSSVGCQNLAGLNAMAFGSKIVANCFYRTDGDRVRYWTFSFMADGRVAYVELEK